MAKNTTDYKAGYEALRGMDLKKIDGNLKHFEGIVKQHAKANPKASKIKVEDFKLLVRIAQQCKEEEFKDFVTTGNIPKLKLSPSEMERLKGGGWIIDSIKAIFEVGADFCRGIADGWNYTEPLAR